MKFFLFLFLFPDNNSIDKIDVREMYQEATSNEKACVVLYELLKNDSTIDLFSSKSAFYGGALSLMANYSKNPLKKLMYTKQADQVLDQSVNMDPKNFDARALRILFNSKVPSVFSNKSELKEDLYVFNQLNKNLSKTSTYNEWIISIINEVQTNPAP